MKFKLKNIKYLNVFILIFFAFSCVDINKIKYSDFYDIDSQGLKPDLEYIFYPFNSRNKDYLGKNFNIHLSVRYKDTMPLNSLPLKIEWLDSNDNIQSKNMIISLFDNEDQREGAGNWGIYETSQYLLTIEKPDSIFFMSISTQEKNTKGLISLGIICKNSD